MGVLHKTRLGERNKIGIGELHKTGSGELNKTGASDADRNGNGEPTRMARGPGDGLGHVVDASGRTQKSSTNYGTMVATNCRKSWWTSAVS